MILRILGLIVLSAVAAFSQEPPIEPGVSKSIGACSKVGASSVSYWFKRDEKARADSNDEAEVLRAVLEKVRKQLRAKVGNEFMKYIHFSHVAGIDFDRRSHLTLDNLTRIDAYAFTFEVRLGENEDYRYAFAIGTDKFGAFLSDVYLPEIARDGSKGSIRTCNDAVAIARETKVLTDTQRLFVNLIYDRLNGIFVWDVYSYRKETGLHSDHVWLNANSLAIIKKYDEWAAF